MRVTDLRRLPIGCRKMTQSKLLLNFKVLKQAHVFERGAGKKAARKDEQSCGSYLSAKTRYKFHCPFSRIFFQLADTRMFLLDFTVCVCRHFIRGDFQLQFTGTLNSWFVLIFYFIGFHFPPSYHTVVLQKYDNRNTVGKSAG